MENKWVRKYLFGLEDISRQEMEMIFDTAASFRELSGRKIKKAPVLRGKTVVNLFFENSTRTRISFELAAKRLSADVLNFTPSGSSLQKGETMADTIKNLEAYHPDIFVIRSGYSKVLRPISKYTSASIVNAGDGCNEHPTQALLDMFTVKEAKGSLDGLNVLIVGDIMHSRVARSNIYGFSKFGARVKICGPATLIPYKFGETMGVEVFYDLDKALKDTDVVIMLRLQNERQKHSYFPSMREYVEKFSLDRRRLESLGKSALVLHPGPINWDAEINSQIEDKVHPLILRQVENGLAIRMAVLYLVGGRSRGNEK